ncbi:MAG: hypothetical protein HY912_03745 [Desulfomonile tiedjei]|uniref:Uncharacterized protein n=1 Tax=Desulfomonile tiedjei TaxID=2358 RepID=A0A9D6UZ88_9BACT|nr:hypothetical protein [Desulfomonile tiedjei]
MDRLKRRLPILMALAIMLVVDAPVGFTEDIPIPMCYAIKAYVTDIDNATKAYSSADESIRDSIIHYAKMQLDLAYNRYKDQITFGHRVNIFVNADELLTELNRNSSYLKSGDNDAYQRSLRDIFVIENKLRGLCTG